MSFNSSENTFQMILNRYTLEERKIILSMLTDNEVEALKMRYGVNFNTVLDVDSNTMELVNYIIFTTIPEFLSSVTYSEDVSVREDLKFLLTKREKRGRKALSLKCMLYEKYGVKDIDLAISGLDSFEIETLKKRYGDDFDQVLEVDDVVSSTCRYIIRQKINKKFKDKDKNSERIKSENNNSDSLDNVSFIELLKQKYTADEIKFIISQLTEDELLSLEQRYGENFDQVLDVPSETMSICEMVLYQKIPSKVTLYREEKPKEAVGIKTKKKPGQKPMNLKELLKIHYNIEDALSVISLLPDKDIDTLKQRYGDDFDQVLDVDSKTLIRSRDIISKKITRIVSFDDSSDKKIIGIKKAKPGRAPMNLKELLKKRYNIEDSLSVISLLSDKDINTLKQRYGENFDQVLDVDRETLIRSRDIVSKKIAKVISKGNSSSNVVDDINTSTTEVTDTKDTTRVTEVTDTKDTTRVTEVTDTKDITRASEVNNASDEPDSKAVDDIEEMPISIEESLFSKLKPHLVEIRDFLEVIINTLDKSDVDDKNSSVKKKKN